MKETLKYKLKQRALNKIKDADVIEFLNLQIEGSYSEGYEGAKVKDAFIKERWFINNYEFYTSKNGGLWARRVDLKEIKSEIAYYAWCGAA